MGKRLSHWVCLVLVSGLALTSVAQAADPRLVGWWKLDEASGRMAADSSGYGNHGTVYGNTTWVPGIFNGALQFDGYSTWVDCGGDASLDLPNAVTIAAWIKMHFADGDRKIAGNQDNRNGGYKFGVYYNNLVEFEVRSSTNYETLNRTSAGGTPLQPGAWYHVAGVYSRGQGIRTYVNGRLDREMITDAVAGSSSGSLKLGREPFANLYSWLGALDDVAVFNAALTESEIQTLMLGLELQPPAAASGPITEDFESSDFSHCPWVQGGNLDWQISSQERHWGLYSAASGPLADGESSVLKVTLACVTGQITFYRKVSSEAGCDNLMFFIDGEEQARWSGEEDWAQVTFPVAGGTRVFEWVYAKDSSFSKGADTAWIDDITFPLDAPVELPPAEPQGFDLYVDGAGPSVLASRPPNVGLLNYYCQDDPAGGSYCIHWTGVDQYGRISFQFKSVKDLSAEVGQGFAVELWTRCDNRSAQVDIRFLDTKTGQPGDRPWRMRYPINSSIAHWTGEWNRLVMPLRQFSEHGAWDEGAWWPPIGAFDWKAVEWFEIVAEYYSLQGIHFYFDTIRVIPPGAPG